MQCMLDRGWGDGVGGSIERIVLWPLITVKKNLNCMSSNCITYLDL